MSPPGPYRLDVAGGGPAIKISISGEIDMAAGDPLLETASTALSSEGVQALVLDLKEVTFMDSSGLRAILQCRRLADGRGVALKIAISDGPVSRLLDLAGVRDRFSYE